jgi:hypothetical protein
MLTQERGPWPVSQRCGRNHQHALSTVFDRLANQLACNERLAEPDAVRHNDSAIAAKDHPRERHSIALKGC